MPQDELYPEPQRYARIIRRQVAYADSVSGLATARNLVATKLHHSRALLLRYFRHLARRSDERNRPIAQTINQLSHLAARCGAAMDRASLFQLDATGGKLYWHAYALLVRQPEWRRTHPHATDPLNILLNSGYVMLARQCRRAIVTAGLLPEVGVLHGDTVGDALVYDFMEIFRARAVDATILPFYTKRHRHGIDRTDAAFTKAMGYLGAASRRHYRYGGRWEMLSQIMELEAVKLRRAIVGDQPWEAQGNYWAHREQYKKADSGKESANS